MNKKMTIDEAASFLGISKEAIHNRIRRGSLKYIIEDDIKYVFVEKTTQKKSANSKHNQDKLTEFLEKQNLELQQKIEKLELQNQKLREQKEELLIQERKRIEQIYKEKDEQLKNILNAISSKFLLEAKPIEEEHIEAQIEEDEIISLKKYIKTLNLSDKKTTKLLKKIKKIAKDDTRFIKKDKKIYLNLTKYDYSDIF